MSIKYKSETFRHGEPLDHELAVLFVKHYLEDKDPQLVCSTNHVYTYPDFFRRQKGILYERHKPDLTVERFNDYYMRYDIKGVIEFDGKTDYEVTLEDGTIIRGKKTRHDTPEQRIRDGIFMDYMAEFHKKVKVFRIEKADPFNKAWLQTKLGGLF